MKTPSELEDFDLEIRKVFDLNKTELDKVKDFIKSLKSDDYVKPMDVIRRTYAETQKINFGDPDNEITKAFLVLNEVQDILGLYLEGELEMWEKEYGDAK